MHRQWRHRTKGDGSSVLVADEPQGRQKNRPLLSLFVIVGIVLITLGISACAAGTAQESDTGNVPADTAEAEPVDAAQGEPEELPPGVTWDTADLPELTEDDVIGSEAQALYEVYKEVKTYNGGKYIAIEPYKVPIEDKKTLFALINEDCKAHNRVLLLTTRGGLTKGGYIDKEGMGFREGFILSYPYFSYDGDTLIVGGDAWYGNLGAEGRKFALEKDETGKWVMSAEQPLEMWVS